MTGHQLLGNKYRLDRLLGKGAFGEVYLAEHNTLHAMRALKILRRDAPGVGSSDTFLTRQRFALEAQIGAQLEQADHVIRVHDFEEMDNVLVLVMEYAPGGSLADRIDTSRRDAMPVPEVVRIAQEIAKGLSALHDLEIVHRDLKPSNILFDAQDQARVADFGLAQVGFEMHSVLGSDALPHPGTPAYMSPEQRNTPSHLTPASDIYTLGAILFEMLTGKLWRNARPGTTPGSLRSDVPEWLDILVMRCLTDDPEARPWDGAELLALLDAGCQGAPEKSKETLTLAPGVEMAFTTVPAGQFFMGSDQDQDPAADTDEAPRHAVSLNSYQMGTCPVTNAQFKAFVEATGYRTLAETRGMSVAYTGAGFNPVQGADWLHPQGPGSAAQGNHPVVHVNWEDAAAFCQWASQVTGSVVRLPTEAEWEKAARGTNGQVFPWGNSSPNATICNIGRCTFNTTPVGAFSPGGDSPFGCTDMAGNVWEWCADWYAADAYTAAQSSNPAGPGHGQFRVVRGGAWYDEPDFARVTLRLWHAPVKTHALLGFRCVAELTTHEPVLK